MSATRRVTKDPEERKSELIDTAERLFLERGYENTTVSDIAKDVKVAQGTFYYYFASKQDILDVVIEREIDAPKKKLPELVRIGKDGLIVSKGMYSGLLLPLVAPEWGFDSMEFLSQTCLKAGLPPDAWLDEDIDVLHFEAQIFAEVSPGQEIIEKTYADTSCGDLIGMYQLNNKFLDIRGFGNFAYLIKPQLSCVHTLFH